MVNFVYVFPSQQFKNPQVILSNCSLSSMTEASSVNCVKNSGFLLSVTCQCMIAVNLDNYSLSYFNKVHNVLYKYQLPTLNELRIKQPTKESWRSTVKEAVNKYWTESLKNEAYEKSSLRYLNIDSMKMGETYSLWKSLDSIVSDVRKGTIKCRMLTGTYMLQSTSHKFSKANVSATCKCCGLYDEDLAHMLLESPAFIHQRKPIYSQFKTKVINCIGAQGHWTFRPITISAHVNFGP